MGKRNLERGSDEAPNAKTALPRRSPLDIHPCRDPAAPSSYIGLRLPLVKPEDLSLWSRVELSAAHAPAQDRNAPALEIAVSLEPGPACDASATIFSTFAGSSSRRYFGISTRSSVLAVRPTRYSLKRSFKVIGGFAYEPAYTGTGEAGPTRRLRRPRAAPGLGRARASARPLGVLARASRGRRLSQPTEGGSVSKIGTVSNPPPLTGKPGGTMTPPPKPPRPGTKGP
jgi:hypothetical protein